MKDQDKTTAGPLDNWLVCKQGSNVPATGFASSDATDRNEERSTAPAQIKSPPGTDFKAIMDGASSSYKESAASCQKIQQTIEGAAEEVGFELPEVEEEAEPGTELGVAEASAN